MKSIKKICCWTLSVFVIVSLSSCTVSPGQKLAKEMLKAHIEGNIEEENRIMDEVLKLNEKEAAIFFEEFGGY